MFKPAFRSALFCLALLAGLAVHPAQAALYAYIDAQGMPHFANQRLNPDYQLYLADGAASPLNSSVPTVVDPKMEAKRTVLLKKMQRHPEYKKIDPLIQKYAKQHAVDPALMKAMMAVESGFNASAVSPKGAIGLMQIIPATGQRYGVQTDTKQTVEQKLAEPKINISTAARYLKDLTKMFAGKEELMLAAYNAGENAVIRFRNKIPPYPETQNYVKSVMQLYQFFGPKKTMQTGAVPPTNNGRVFINVDPRAPNAAATTVVKDTSKSTKPAPAQSVIKVAPAPVPATLPDVLPATQASSASPIFATSDSLEDKTIK